MKFKFIVLIALALAFQKPLAAPHTQDIGKITSIYVNAGGTLAITLDNAFANARSGGQCPTANGYGGNALADAAFKSALLAAKTAQQTVTVTVQGCEANGHWYKIIDVYVN